MELEEQPAVWFRQTNRRRKVKSKGVELEAMKERDAFGFAVGRKVKSKGVELEAASNRRTGASPTRRKVKSKGVELERAGEPSRCEFDER